jgi:hypothetical protein
MQYTLYVRNSTHQSRLRRQFFLPCILSFKNRSYSSLTHIELQKTGTFRTNIPDVFPPSTHYRRALKTLHVVKVDEKIKNIASRKRKYISQVIIKLMTGLTAPLTEILKSFRNCMAHLHPYEAVVTTLTLSTREKAGHKSLQVSLVHCASLCHRYNYMYVQLLL